MTSHVHAFDAREGGSFRVSLMYDAPTGTDKTTAHTDTYHGRFVTLVPNEQVVEVVEFETTDPAMRGEMTITFALADVDGGTDVVAMHDRLPPGLSAAVVMKEADAAGITRPDQRSSVVYVVRARGRRGANQRRVSARRQPIRRRPTCTGERPRARSGHPSRFR